jgi:hypothetical protein
LYARQRLRLLLRTKLRLLREELLLRQQQLLQ